jgi:hypothetical protein
MTKGANAQVKIGGLGNLADQWIDTINTFIFIA